MTPAQFAALAQLIRLRAATASVATAGPAVRELQALGDVHVGMCGSWEFVGR